jgi:hypothetical protein
LHSLLALESPFHPGLKHCVAISAIARVSVPSRPESLHCIICWRWSLCLTRLEALHCIICWRWSLYSIQAWIFLWWSLRSMDISMSWTVLQKPCLQLHVRRFLPCSPITLLHKMLLGSSTISTDRYFTLLSRPTSVSLL